MSTKIPMSFYTFKRFITNSMEQSDWIDGFYKLGFDGLAEKILSYDDVLDLLAYIFDDNEDILNQWVYENNYGREQNIDIIYDNHVYQTIEDIYDLLIKIYNNEIEPFEIEIKRR